MSDDTARPDPADDRPTIVRVLELSTSHLPEHVAQIGPNAFNGVIADPLPYGWLLWVPDDPDKHAADYDDPIPPELLTIQRYARRRHCRLVLLDRDADTVDALPTFDW